MTTGIPSARVRRHAAAARERFSRRGRAIESARCAARQSIPCAAAALLCAWTAAGQAQSPSSASTVPGELTRIPLRSTTPISQRFKNVIAITERRDPARDDFLPETLAAAAERQLRALSHALARDGAAASHDAASLLRLGSPLLDESAAARELRPAATATVYQFDGLVVRRASPAASQPAADQPADRALADFFAPFDSDTERGCDSLIVAIDDITPHGFSTTALVTAWGRSPARVRQQNATWRIEWSRATPPRIRTIHADDYEDAEDAAPRFLDCTASVLRHEPALLDRLRRGAGHWYHQLDRLPGVDLLGHVGLCIGDANGDGRDDLYVADQGGLPNLLLIQNADGTVADCAAAANVDFRDITRGCLLADLDNDGDDDLILSIRNATVVMENVGAGRFRQQPVLSARTGTPSEFYSIAAADYDRDGFLDLYSTRYVRAAYGVSIPIPYFDANNGPPNHLLSHRGGWQFQDVTHDCGLSQNNQRFSLAAAWEDFDRDGDPDLYVANDFGRSNLYVNDNAHFTDQADARGASNCAAGMGVTWGDFDRDGLPDLYISNMYSPAGMRITSRPEFRPADPADVRAAIRAQAMGNALFRGRPGGRFETASESLRAGVGGWSWGALFLDINNDGLEDLLVPNGNLSGAVRDDIDSLFWRQVAAFSPLTATAAPRYEDGWAAMSVLMQRDFTWAAYQRNVTYLNLGNGQFADISAISGFGLLDDARALAACDWDDDGDLDLWLRNRTGPTLRFLRNTTSDRPGTRHAIRLRLEGNRCNRSAVGAVVTLEVAGAKLTRTVRAGEGYLAQSARDLHFGLGAAESIDVLTVQWPDGAIEMRAGPPVDQRYRILEGTDAPLPFPPNRDTDPLALEPAPWHGLPHTVGDREHILLADRAALANLTLTDSTGRTTTTESKLGRPLVMIFWSGRSPASLDALRRLADPANALADLRVQVVPVCIDAEGDRAAASQAAARIDPALPLIAATPQMLDLLDVLQQEILGRPEDLALPTTLAVDRLGLIVSIQRAGLDVNALAADLRRGPDEAQPFAGRTLFPAPRNYAFIATELRNRGHADQFDFYRMLQLRRKDER